MSAHMKEHRTRSNYVKVTVQKGKKTINYKIPSSCHIQDKLEILLEPWKEDLITPWEEAIPWETVAADRIEKYKKSGLVLRGARLREGVSQKKLSELSGVSQDNISKIEHGKRPVGEKVAKRLGEALHFDYHLLLGQ